MRSSWLRRGWAAALGFLLFSASVATMAAVNNGARSASAAGSASAAAVEGQVPHGDTVQDLRERHDAYVHDRSDPSGTPRPDLEVLGVAHQRGMRVAPGTSPPPPPGAPVRAQSLGGVTGVQWTGSGPQPLRIDQSQNFQGAGPDSGEIVDIAVDPSGTTDAVIYIATNDGGVWKSIDGGVSWRPRTDYMPSLSMGALAVDPSNSSTVYAGTGNGFDGGGVFTNGIGIYKSTDGGDTWTIQNPGGIFSNQSIVRIVEPASNVLVVATSSGVYKSVDGGEHFGANAPNFDDGAPILGGSISDLHRDTANASTIYAAVNGGGLRKSTDSGSTFPADLFDNNIPSHGFVTFSQSTSPDAKTMYANVAVGSAAKIFRTTNANASAPTWSEVTAGSAVSSGCQCGYDQTIGVDPTDVNTVYVGYQKLYATTDGGTTFNPVSDNKIHWDQHALTFSPHASTAPAAVYAGNDGGVARSADRGATWANLDETIASNLFVSMDIGRNSAQNNGYSYGGTQDTGIIGHRPGDTNKDWHLGIDGDGGATVVSRQDPKVVWSSDDACLTRTTDGGTNWSFFAANAGLPTGCDGTSFANARPLAVDPNDQAHLFVVNGTQLYRSDNAAAGSPPTFTAIGPTGGFSASPTAAATIAADSNTLWLGFSDGSVQRTTNALATTPTWTVVTPAGGPLATVSGLALDPSDSQVAVATFEGFSGVGPATGSPTRHVYRTADNGSNWTDISGTDGTPADILPDLPTHSVVIDPDVSPHAIIVSNDAGVLRTIDDGASWQLLGVGLPIVRSSQLQIDTTASPTLLRLGTYGRGVFELTPATGPLLTVQGDASFGSLGIGHIADRVVTLSNLGSSNLTINSFTKTGGDPDFSLVAGTSPVSIPPGSHADFTVRFQPLVAGTKTASFRIASNDQFQPLLTLDASGTAVLNTTSTTLAASANPSLFGAPVTFTATVADVAGAGAFVPSGTVQFFDGTTLLGTATLDGAYPGHASITATGLQVGTHQISAVYSGDAHFLPSTSLPLGQVVRCGTVITGTHSGHLAIDAGSTCIVDATVRGSVTVRTGAAVSIARSKIAGSVTASSATALTICRSDLAALIVSDTTGWVLIGSHGDDNTDCAGNTIRGLAGFNRNHSQVEFADNVVQGGVLLMNSTGLGPPPDNATSELEANTISGSLVCLGSVPPPTNDGASNQVGGTETGQCTGL